MQTVVFGSPVQYYPLRVGLYASFLITPLEDRIDSARRYARECVDEEIRYGAICLDEIDSSQPWV